MKSVLSLLLLVSLPLAAQTPSSISISPQGSAVLSGSTQQFTAACTYAAHATDNCTFAGGVTWVATRSTAATVSGTGLATWVTDPGANAMNEAYILAKAGGLVAKAGFIGQHVGDTWYPYTTPAYTSTSVFNVAIGATVTFGEGLNINNSSPGATSAFPYDACNWSTSNAGVATVDLHGLVTAVAVGTATITCGHPGNAVFGTSANTQWVTPGNTSVITVVAGGTGTTTWYVLPNGGTVYSASNTAGQCSGKVHATYAAAGGAGVNQACGAGNMRYLWADGVTAFQMQWLIAGGDTVIVDPQSGGYNMNLDAPSPYQTPAGASWNPVNCQGNVGCTMPTIPSGTTTGHTKILGSNYASCHADASKTLLNVSYAGYAAFNVGGSQFVDIGCFKISDQAACAKWANFTNNCGSGFGNQSNFGRYGIAQSALTSYANYTDILIDGVAFEGINGATGLGVAANYLHIRGVPFGGIDMDDGPWGISNISVAGGFTMNYSTTEFVGCVEEYPVVHNYPYIECRDQNVGAYGDGFGTGTTVGAWSFDHDLWFANFQDGLDLLHSGMQTLSITNSQSIANDGQSYKIGSAENVTFLNNVSMVNCARIGQVFGDEPAAAIVAGVTLCRAAGDQIVVHFTDTGTYLFQNNTFAGYGATMFDMFCENGWDFCQNANSRLQNNIMLGITNTNYNASLPPGLFCLEGAGGTCTASVMPANLGWATRTNNAYFGMRGGCPTLLTGELCADALFVAEPANTISSETVLDNYNFNLSGASTLKAAGLFFAATSPDPNGVTRSNPSSMGALEYVTATLTSITVTPNPAVVVGFGSYPMTCTQNRSDGSHADCTTLATWSMTSGSSFISVNSSTGVVSGIAVGTATVQASFGGFISAATVNNTNAPAAGMFGNGRILGNGAIR